MMWLYKLNHFPQSPLEWLLKNLLRKVDLKKKQNIRFKKTIKLFEFLTSTVWNKYHFPNNNFEKLIKSQTRLLSSDIGCALFITSQVISKSISNVILISLNSPYIITNSHIRHNMQITYSCTANLEKLIMSQNQNILNKSNLIQNQCNCAGGCKY